jgi:glycerol-3-phosphate dehydrogenase (NAD(P)+)
MASPQIEEVIVIGAGNWGLTLASLFSKTKPTRVWAVNAEAAEHLKAHRECVGDFFKYPIPTSVVIEEKYASSFDVRSALFIMAVPSKEMANAARELRRHASDPIVVTASKGFDAERQCTMSQLIKYHIPDARLIVLTGPTIANEVAEGKPTRAVLASDDLMHLAMVKQALSNDVIFFELSRNPAHHEICAALKGLIAMAVGMADQLQLGANIQGVLMTQGIQELGVVASFFGIPTNITTGISGTGDLITTCISEDSRNRRLGKGLADGLTREEALERVQMTVEGVSMSQTIETLWSLDVSIPLIHMTNRILQGNRTDIRAELLELIASL